jgi:hypothetical protein
MEDLARVCGQRCLALHAEEAGIAPYKLHHAFYRRPGTEYRQEGLCYRTGVQWTNPRVHEQPQARLAIGSLLFQELVVGGRSPEAGWQLPLENADDVRIQEVTPPPVSFS